MKDFLASILGTYTAVSYEATTTVYDAAGNVLSETVADIIPSGLAGVDWLYVLSGVAFIVLLFCALKLLGGIICKIS